METYIFKTNFKEKQYLLFIEIFKNYNNSKSILDLNELYSKLELNQLQLTKVITNLIQVSVCNIFENNVEIISLFTFNLVDDKLIVKFNVLNQKILDDITNFINSELWINCKNHYQFFIALAAYNYNLELIPLKYVKQIFGILPSSSYNENKKLIQLIKKETKLINNLTIDCFYKKEHIIFSLEVSNEK